MGPFAKSKTNNFMPSTTELYLNTVTNSVPSKAGVGNCFGLWATP